MAKRIDIATDYVMFIVLGFIFGYIIAYAMFVYVGIK